MSRGHLRVSDKAHPDLAGGRSRRAEGCLEPSPQSISLGGSQERARINQLDTYIATRQMGDPLVRTGGRGQRSRSMFCIVVHGSNFPPPCDSRTLGPL